MTTRDERIEALLVSLHFSSTPQGKKYFLDWVAKHNFTLMDSEPGEAEVEAATKVFNEELDRSIRENIQKPGGVSDTCMRAALIAARKAGK